MDEWISAILIPAVQCELLSTTAWVLKLTEAQEQSINLTLIHDHRDQNCTASLAWARLPPPSSDPLGMWCLWSITPFSSRTWYL